MDINIKELPFVGQGRHGSVYRLDEKRCIKIFRKKSYLEMEYKVLKHSERFPYFPRVYERKDKYMIREFFEGPDLLEYIKQNGFSQNLAVEILGIIDAFIELGYSRIDCRLPHFIVTQGESLKIIDPARNMTKICPYPHDLLNELDRLGCKQEFLQYIKALRPHYYAQWKEV